MKLEFNHPFLDGSELSSLHVHKRVGDHAHLKGVVHYAAAERPSNLSEVMGAKVHVQIEDGDLKAALFSGVITRLDILESETGHHPLYLAFEAHSCSVASDVVKRSRVFQNPHTTLRKIVEDVIEDIDDVMAGFEGSAEMREGNFEEKVALSIQHSETDFGYLKRLLTPYEIPIIVDDADNILNIGRPHFDRFELQSKDLLSSSFQGRMVAFLGDEERPFSRGRIGELQNGVEVFNKSLRSRDLYRETTAHPDSEKWLQARQNSLDVSKKVTTAGTRVIETRRTIMKLGQRCSIDGETYSVSDVVYSYSVSEGSDAAFRQYYRLLGLDEAHPILSDDQVFGGSETAARSSFGQANRESSSPDLRSETWNAMTPWGSRLFLARIVQNKGDPLNLGRVQIDFDWERGGSKDGKCWVDVLTPYAGSQDQTCGLIMLPEIGEEVLVRFIEPHDDKPVIVGSLRRKPIVENLDTAQHKLIRTPGGSYIDFASEGEQETVSIQAGQSKGPNITIRTSAGSTDVVVSCDESLTLIGRTVKISGEEVSIDASAELTVKSEAVVSVKAGKGLSIDGGALATIKAGMIELN